MKNTLITAFVMVLVVFIGYYLSKKEPELKFSLSENIPTRFLSESQRESVQLLEIINSGSKPANKIRIKINKAITDYDLSKYSISDSVLVVAKEDYFELAYPQLPPQSTFKLILKSRGDGVNESDLQISYEDGLASNLRGNEDGSIASHVLGYLVSILIIFILLNGFKEIKLDDFERQAKNYDSGMILEKKKPIYLTDVRWEKIRILAVDNYFKDITYLHTNIKETKSYIALNNEKPNYISSKEWDRILKEASQQFEYEVSKILTNSAIYEDKLYELLDLHKPTNYDENLWKNIIDKINDYFLSYQKHNDFRFNSNEAIIIRKLQDKKPQIISDIVWKVYLDNLRKYYYDFIISKMRFCTEPFKELLKYNLDLLSTELRDKLEDYCYNLSLSYLPKVDSIITAQEFLDIERPAWINEDDYNKKRDLAKTILNYEVHRKEFHGLLNKLMNLFANGKGANFESPILDNIDQLQFSKVTDDIIEYYEIKDSIFEEAQEVNALKEKVTKQLEIINECLGDPDSIGRIEEYNNPFEPGNFKNLQAIAKHLKIIKENS